MLTSIIEWSKRMTNFRRNAERDNYHDWPKMVEIDYSRPKAAKEYECSMCHRTISKGEPHRKVIYKLDGKFHSDRVHLTCYHNMEQE